MDMVDMSNDNNNNNNNNPPTSRTKDFFASPALSLSLAGIFRDARANAVGPASSEGEEGSCGGGGRRDTDKTVEISSENSGPVRSRSADEDFDNELGDHDLDDFDEDDDGDKKKKNKKRKKYHRHTSVQIREMDA